MINTIKNNNLKYLNEIQLPSDKEIESCPSIYKGISLSHVDSYIENGFQHTLAGDGGTVLGEGIYARLTLNDTRRHIYSYGPSIVEGKVIGGFHNYIMFHGEQFSYIKNLIIKYYGSYLSVEDQIKTIVGCKKDVNLKDYITPNDDEKTIDAKKLYQGRLYINTYRETISLCTKYKIRGMIYEWDGVPTVLAFDFASVVVWAIMRDARYPNAKFEKVFNDSVRERYLTTIDYDYRLRGNRNYDYYDKKITTLATNNQMYILVRKDFKWNFVKLDTTVNSNKQESVISNVWMTNKPTQPSITTGIFQFNYKGISFYGALYIPGSNSMLPGLWFPEDLNYFHSYPDIKSISDWIQLDKDNLEEAYTIITEQDSSSMSNVMEIVKKNFKNVLNEEITDNNESDFLNKNHTYLYRVTSPSTLESLFTNGQLRQFAGSNDGSWYGEGIYAVLNPNSLQYYKYDKETGACAVKLILLNGFKRFLIFDEHWAKKVYGEHYQIKDQIENLFPEEIAADIWNDFSGWMNGNAGDWNKDRLVHNTAAGRYSQSFPTDCSYALIKSPYSNRTTGILHAIFDNSKYLTKYTKLFSQYNIRGAIYNGGNDGLSAVCWQFDQAIPYEYTTDRGRTWRKDKFNFTIAKERSFRNNDPVSKFKHLYKRVSDKIVFCNIQGNKLNVTTVQENDNKWNIININDGKKISPYSFDETPRIGINGFFSFKYKGVNLQGTLLLPQANMPALWYPEDIAKLNLPPDLSSINDWVYLSDIPEVVNELKNS